MHLLKLLDLRCIAVGLSLLQVIKTVKKPTLATITQPGPLVVTKLLQLSGQMAYRHAEKPRNGAMEK